MKEHMEMANQMIDMKNDKYFNTFWNTFCEVTEHDVDNTIITDDEYDQWMNMFADHIVEIESDEY